MSKTIRTAKAKAKARAALVAAALVAALAVVAGPGAGEARADWVPDLDLTTTYTVTVDLAGPAKGTVAGPGGFSCVKPGSAAVSCSYSYSAILGMPKTFTATPGVSSLFGGWSGACGGTGSCTVWGEGTITAQFNVLFVPDLSLTTTDTVRIEGAGAGNGSVTGPSVNCTISAGATSGVCVKDFSRLIVDPPVSRTYTASPAAGYDFVGWSGACSGAGAACTITGDGIATARFEPVPGGGTPATPAPPSDPAPAAPSGGAAAGGPSSTGMAANEVEAEIAGVVVTRSRLGKKLVRVELLADERVRAVVTLERRGDVLRTKRVRLEGGTKLVTLVLPKRVRGRVILGVVFRDASDMLDLTRAVRLGR